MINNEYGYSFELINFDKGIFDEGIDATYVIHLKDNGRLDHIKEQLLKFRPTKVCYILINEGYKNNNKKKYIDTPDKDLRDCNFTIFKHAYEKKYNNILIHEDDFFYDEKVFINTNKYNINKFMLENINNEFIYYLGCIPFILNKVNNNHNKLIIGYTSHAIIYSKKIIDKLITINPETIKLVYDNFLCIDPIFENIKYTYKIPLCFQLHDITENAKDWLSLNIYFNKKDIKENLLLNVLNDIVFDINKKIMIDILKLNKEKNLKFFIETLYNLLKF